MIQVDGSFVWADSTDADFTSSAANTFNVRATGGVVLNTSGAGVTLDGSAVLTTSSGVTPSGNNSFAGDNAFTGNNTFTAVTEQGINVKIHHCSPGEFGSKLFRYTAGEDFMQAFLEKTKGLDFKGLADENAVFEKAGLPYIQPENRATTSSIRVIDFGSA